MDVARLTACLLATASLLLPTSGPADTSTARTVARAAASEQVTITLTLTGLRPAEQAAVAMSTPGNRSHRRFLDITELRQQFGAPADRVTRVSRWARVAGLTVGALDATGTRLPVTGSTEEVEKAFGVTLGHSVRDGVRVRTTSALKIPPVIEGDVSAVAGLDQQVAHPLNRRPGTALQSPQGVCLTAPPTLGIVSAEHAELLNLGAARATCLARAVGAVPAAAGTQEGEFCSTYWGEWNNADVPQRYPAGRQSNQVCGYTGPQLRSLYGLTGAETGAGQTIVIVGAYDNASTLADANTTFAANGVPALPAADYQVRTYAPNGSVDGCDEDSWHLEQALDVQTVHTLAPAARIVYAAAGDCTQLEETLAAVIADTSLNATIVSASWGILTEPSDTTYLASMNALLARAAILGIGTYVASGDYGDTTTATGTAAAGVSFPASSPWATAVGGTTTAIGADLSPLWQTGWEDAANTRTGSTWTRLSPPFIGGAGGGASAHFDKPTWQATLPGNKRAVPDIAALADPYTGLFVGATIDGRYGAGPVGGTSLAAPIVASLAALAQARAGSGSDIGLLTPLLYDNATAGNATTSDVGHVAAGVWTPQLAGAPAGDYLVDADAGVESLQTSSGWDPATGLGTPGRTFLSDVA